MASVDELSSLNEIVKILGSPTAAIFSGAVAVVWIGRQLVSLRTDFQQGKMDSAKAMLKVWSELERQRPETADPRYDLLEQKIYGQLGLTLNEPINAESAEAIPDDIYKQPTKLPERFLYSATGACLGTAINFVYRLEPLLSLMSADNKFVLVGALSAAGF
jgi:hypothetical protein